MQNVFLVDDEAVRWNELAENESFQKVTKYLEIDCDNNTQHSACRQLQFEQRFAVQLQKPWTKGRILAAQKESATQREQSKWEIN